MHKPNCSVIAFGEILFDCFPDRSYIGGGPLNFAWDLSQLHLPVALVSALGRDELGRQARAFLQEANIDQTWVADRPEPTGTVDIRLQGGEPEFSINRNVAWEHIDPTQPLDTKPQLLYFGSAAQCSEINRQTLRLLLDLQPRHRLYDANMRPNAYTDAIVLESLDHATLLKLNEEEWELIQQLTGQTAPEHMLTHFNLDAMAITRGADGATLYLPDQILETASPPSIVIDTVGAGDAFSAVWAAGVLLALDPAHLLELACTAGAAAVRQPGAQITLPDAVIAAFKPEI